MDLRSLANSLSSSVNPNIIVTLRRSTGYASGAGYKQVPTYADPVSGPANVQALDGEELKQLDGLNIQGEVKGVFLRGALAGVLRPDSTGGDLLDIPAPFAGTWLVVKVLEGWDNWTKAAIVRQES